MRIQKITLENGMEVYINHNFKEKCIDCKKEIIWAYVALDLVGLAKWDLHKCEETPLKRSEGGKET